MTGKLLHKTLRAYLIFAVAILLLAAPLFYFISEKLYLEDADETLVQHKEEFVQIQIPKMTISDIPVWNRFNRDIKIYPSNGWRKDSLFNTFYFDSLANENEPYRELNSTVLIENQPFTYSGRINLVESEDLMESIAWLFFVLIILLLTGLYFITRGLSKQLWKPFYETLEIIGQFEIDKNKQPGFKDSEVEEFNRLNLSISKLIERNLLIFKSQREFVENAAHELQTPLAVFQAKIDLLIQGSDFTDQQYELLESLNENLARLNRLNRNLLLLSKIENQQFQEVQIVNLAFQIRRNLDFFVEQAESKNLKIELNLDENVVVETHEILVEILISNLFLNAIRHNVPNGKIEVELNLKSLKYSNSGRKESLPTDQIFNRFSKVNPSESGTGLGLAIVKKIVEVNGWKIGYQFENEKHSFEIWFMKGNAELNH